MWNTSKAATWAPRPSYREAVEYEHGEVVLCAEAADGFSYDEDDD